MMKADTRMKAYKIAVRRSRVVALLIGASLTLSGCISLGGEPPESLLTLSSSATAPAGSGSVAGVEGAQGAIAVQTPEVPAKLDVMRVPVNVSDTEVAYLQDAVWIEKPARLFRRLLGETLRTRGGGLVIDGDEAPTPASQTLRGTLIEMGYDAQSNSVLVRFDAVRTDSEGAVISRRFEARENVSLPEAVFVGPALNRAANTVAGDVADWVLSSE